jgi:putative transposase
VFLADADFAMYLRLLRDCLEAHGVDLLAYCLMMNHIHLVAVPEALTSLGGLMHQLQSTYANRARQRGDIAGDVWHGRFYSTPMDEYHMWAGIRYVERNPVRARIVTSAADYPWSSAAGHSGLRRDPLPAESVLLEDRPADWAAWLMDECEADSAFVRKCTMSGVPCMQRRPR